MLWFIVIAELVLLIAVAVWAFAPKTKSLSKAEQLEKEGNLEEALKIFLRALKKDPNNVDVLWHLARINEDMGRYLEAIGYYQQILKLNKQSALFSKFDVLKRIGLLYYHSGYEVEAFGPLYRAYRLNSMDKDVNYALGLIAASQGFFNIALRFLEGALPFMKKNAEFFKYYGLVLMQLNKYDRCLEAFETAVKLNPVDPMLKVLLGSVLVRFGRASSQRAVTILEPVAEDPKDLKPVAIFILYRALGFAYMNMGVYDKAENYFKMAYEQSQSAGLDKWKADSLMDIVMLYAKAGRYEDALNYVNGVALAGGDIAAVDELSKVLMAVHDEELSKQEGEQQEGVVKKSPQRRTLENLIAQWENNPIPSWVIWTIAGLKPKKRFDVVAAMEKLAEEAKETVEESFRFEIEEGEDLCEYFANTDPRTFVALAEEIIKKLGYSIVRLLEKADVVSLIEGEGVDYIVSPIGNSDVKHLAVVRRWKTGRVSRIPLMDFLDKANENGCEKVIFITTGELMEDALNFVEQNRRIELYKCDDITPILRTLVKVKH